MAEKCNQCGEDVTVHGCQNGRKEITDLILNPNKTVYYPPLCKNPSDLSRTSGV